MASTIKGFLPLGWENIQDGEAIIKSATGVIGGSLSASVGAGSITNTEISPTAAIDVSKIANGLVSNAEFQYLDGVTSSIQTQLGARHIIGDGTLPDLMVFTDADETLKSIGVTETEALTLQGASSNIQNQLNARALSATTVSAGTGLTGGGDLSANRTISHAAHTGDVTGTTTLTIAPGAVVASHLDSMAVGVDPVFGNDDTTGASVLANGGTYVVPAGVWWAYINGTNTSIQTFLNGTWRAVGGMGGSLVGLIISNGTNVRAINNDTDNRVFWARRVYP